MKADLADHSRAPTMVFRHDDRLLERWLQLALGISYCFDDYPLPQFAD